MLTNLDINLKNKLIDPLKKKRNNTCWRACREKRNPHALLVGMQTGTATVENSMDVTEKIKNTITRRFSNSTTDCFPKESENTNLKRYMHPYVYYSIIYYSQVREAT